MGELKDFKSRTVLSGVVEKLLSKYLTPLISSTNSKRCSRLPNLAIVFLALSEFIFKSLATSRAAPIFCLL